jgi:hypothetical protein
MIYGYARVWTNVQSVSAQAAALRKRGAGKVFREVASGAKPDRAQLRRLLDQLDTGDRRDGDAARPTSGPPPRQVEHVRGDHCQGARFLSGNISGHTSTAHGRLTLTPVSSAI